MREINNEGRMTSSLSNSCKCNEPPAFQYNYKYNYFFVICLINPRKLACFIKNKPQIQSTKIIINMNIMKHNKTITAQTCTCLQM